MVAAVAADGVVLSKSQVDRDFREGAPRHSAAAYLAWRMEHRELGRTADSRIDRAQNSGSTSARVGEQQGHSALPDASAENRGGATPPPSEMPGSALADVDLPAGEPPEPADEHTLNFRRDRAANERIKSERAQLELDQMRGRLVDVRQVEELQFTAGRITRDRVLMVPARVAADLHGLLLTLIPDETRAAFAEKVPMHAFETRLDDALRQALSEADKAIEDAGRDDDHDDPAS